MDLNRTGKRCVGWSLTGQSCKQLAASSFSRILDLDPSGRRRKARTDCHHVGDDPFVETVQAGCALMFFPLKQGKMPEIRLIHSSTKVNVWLFSRNKHKLYGFQDLRTALAREVNAEQVVLKEVC